MSKIKDLNLDLPAEFYAVRTEGIMSRPLKNSKAYTMQPVELKEFVSELVCQGFSLFIEESLQSLAMRKDGTLLLTSFPEITEVKRVFSGLASVSSELSALVLEWESMGCTEVNIDFVQNN